MTHPTSTMRPMFWIAAQAAKDADAFLSYTLKPGAKASQALLNRLDGTLRTVRRIREDAEPYLQSERGHALRTILSAENAIGCAMEYLEEVLEGAEIGGYKPSFSAPEAATDVADLRLEVRDAVNGLLQFAVWANTYGLLGE